MTDYFKFYLQDTDGNYFVAIQDPHYYDTYGVFTQTEPKTISVLPDGWQKFTLKWTRNQQYWGVFRTQSSTFKFTRDARAILKVLLYGGNVNGVPYTGITGIQAQCRLGILRQRPDYLYEIIYQCNLNFQTAKDDLQNEIFEIATLDSYLREKIQAYASTEYNIPYWHKIDGFWHPEEGCAPILHSGIKALFLQRHTKIGRAHV